MRIVAIAAAVILGCLIVLWLKLGSRTNVRVPVGDRSECNAVEKLCSLRAGREFVTVRNLSGPGHCGDPGSLSVLSPSTQVRILAIRGKQAEAVVVSQSPENGVNGTAVGCHVWLADLADFH